MLASNGGLFTGEYALVGPPSDDRVDGLKERLAQNAVDFAETSRNGLPLLTLAARRRQPEICRLLLEAGCDVDQKNADGKTPLRFATSVDVINLLIDAGADVEARSNDGATPLEGWVKFLRQRPAIELSKRGARFDSLDADALTLNPYVARFTRRRRAARRRRTGAFCRAFFRRFL